MKVIAVNEELLCIDMCNSISLKKAFTSKDFSDLLGEIRSRLEYTEDMEGERVPVK